MFKLRWFLIIGLIIILWGYSWAGFFENAEHNFKGDMTTFVLGIDGQGGEIISAAAMDYNRESKDGSPLRTVGTVTLNGKGIVAGNNAKSGWVNYKNWGKYTNAATGVLEYVIFEGVSFWVHEGGNNWFDFEIKKALLAKEEDGEIKPTTQEVKISAKIEQVAQGINQPVVIVEGKYKLVPRVISLSKITFVEEEKSPPQKQKATTKPKKK